MGQISEGGRELQQEMVSWRERVNAEFAPKGIEWFFNPPLAPHTGGMFERLVKSFMRGFVSLNGDRDLTADVFHTLLIMAEGILNSRPLTPVSNDPDDFDCLTPNPFLHPGVTTTKVTTNIIPPTTDVPPSILLKHWRHVQSLTDAFWKRFTREYISTLQQRRKWTGKRRNLDVGDVVLVVENTPRDEWNMARVIATFPDREGLVRRVCVKTMKKKKLERQVNSLVLLEATDKDLAEG